MECFQYTPYLPASATIGTLDIRAIAPTPRYRGERRSFFIHVNAGGRNFAQHDQYWSGGV
jgi:hypothetical protein